MYLDHALTALGEQGYPMLEAGVLTAETIRGP